MNLNPSTSETDAALDRLLQTHLAAPAEQLTASSGFALSIMETIHQQAIEPPPIAFPWRRVLPGAIAILCALVAFVLFLTGPRVLHPLAFSSLTYREAILSSVLMAACISGIVVAVSFRLAGRDR
jgi:hypothetical protein